MKKLTKIAAAIIAAMTMATSMVGISASADDHVSRSDTAYGTLSGDIFTGANSLTQRWFNFSTSTTNTAYKLVMSGDVDSYTTGALLERFENYTGTSTSSLSKKVYLNEYHGTTVSAFGAHEAKTSSGSSWGVYTSCPGFEA